MDAAMLPAAIPVGVKPAAATVAGTATSAPTAPAAAAAAGAATPAAAVGATPDEGEPVIESTCFALPDFTVRPTTAGVKGFSPFFLPAIAACVLQPRSSPEFCRSSHFAHRLGARPPATARLDLLRITINLNRTGLYLYVHQIPTNIVRFMMFRQKRGDAKRAG
jgi:hypothetical protein